MTRHSFSARTLAIAVGTTVAVMAVVLGLPSTASAATASATATASAAPDGGSAPAAATAALTVQLAFADGSSARRQGVTIALVDGTAAHTRRLVTGADGSVTFTGLVGDTVYGVDTASIPNTGATTITSAVHDGIWVAAGETGSVDLTVAIGATVTGRIVGPTGAPAVQKQVVAFGGGGYHSANSDANGVYTFVGMATGVYTVEAAIVQGHEQGVWKTRVVEQVGTTPAWHVTLSTHFLHRDYDLVVDPSTQGPAVAISGATVQVLNAVGTVVASQRTSGIVDSSQDTRFEIPSGTYRVRILTVATAEVPSQTLWLATGGGSFTADAGNAARVPVTYGGLQSFSAVIAD